MAATVRSKSMEEIRIQDSSGKSVERVNCRDKRF
jgi:hypothetical protein